MKNADRDDVQIIVVRLVKKETKKDVLLVLEPDGDELWFPKSQIRGEYDLGDSDITLTIPAWLADENEIIPFCCRELTQGCSPGTLIAGIATFFATARGSGLKRTQRNANARTQ